MLALSRDPDEDFDHSDADDLLGALPTEPVIAVADDVPLDELIPLFLQRRASAVVVVDAARRVRGVVAPLDLLEATTRTEQLTAGDVMIAAFVLGADTSVACAAAVMAYEGVDHVVVADARGQLRCVVTARDIAHQLASRAGYVGLTRRR